jgi:hypothetical protein
LKPSENSVIGKDPRSACVCDRWKKGPCVAPIMPTLPTWRHKSGSHSIYQPSVPVLALPRACDVDALAECPIYLSKGSGSMVYECDVRVCRQCCHTTLLKQVYAVIALWIKRHRLRQHTYERRCIPPFNGRLLLSFFCFQRIERRGLRLHHTEYQ